MGAIEELTARGVNVNVTLLFSVERYEQVIEAYLRGLERRVAAGEPVAGISSVASFFVSRIDAKADAMLAPELAAARAGRDRQRPPSLTGAIWRASAASAGSRCNTHGATPAAPALGEHGNQGPRALRRPLRRAADCSRRDQHDAREDAARVRRPRRRRRTLRPDLGAANGVLAGAAAEDVTLRDHPRA